MRCPDIEPILRPLKPFQLKTVEHAFHRLFTAKDSTSRFLVADEVGLGKTLVARGVIARTIAHLWDTVPQIDIVYICSNGSIARSNLPKLHIPIAGEQSYEMATRLTMLATQLASKTKRKSTLANKVNLVSFTPATSFNMGHSTGRWEERQLLYQLLLPIPEIDAGRHRRSNMVANTTRTPQCPPSSWNCRAVSPSHRKRFQLHPAGQCLARRTVSKKSREMAENGTGKAEQVDCGCPTTIGSGLYSRTAARPCDYG
jgi:hypothetical protein